MVSQLMPILKLILLWSYFMHVRGGPSDIGKVLTWNIRAAYTKFSSEGDDAIKDVVCNYIDKAGVVAYQEATKLPDLCTMADFKACKIQDCPFVTLVKTTDTDPFTLLDKLQLDSNQPPFATAVSVKAENINKGESFVVVNVQYSPRNTRRDDQVKATIKLIEDNLKGKFYIIIVLGDFSMCSDNQLKDLLSIMGSESKSVIRLDPRAPITTVEGKRLDNILINNGDVKELNIPEFSKNVDGKDPRFSNLVNNYVVLSSFGKDPINLKKCIDEYVEKQTTDSDPCKKRWLSSRMLTDHLPVQLGLKVINTAQKETDLLVDTWNIKGDDLAKKVSDPETSRLLETAVKKFNILVFQELFDASSTPYVMQVDTTVPLGKPEHGYFLQDTVNVKLAVDTPKIKHFQVGNNGKSVSRIPVSIEVNSNEKYKVCFYSIHFPARNTKQRDIIKELQGLQTDAKTDTDCQLSLALGDFNSELSKWPKNTLKNAGLNDVLSCKGIMDTKEFQYTKVETMNHIDYIIVLSIDSTKFKVDKCVVSLTGAGKPNDVKIEDWREISDHYPVLVELKD